MNKPIFKQNIYSTPSKADTSRNAPSPPTTAHQPLYVIVFGYPSSRFSATAVHFQSLAESGTTEPEASADVENAFKIGYRQPWEAARAWKKNGETISSDGGRWMVGVKWAVSLEQNNTKLEVSIDDPCAGSAIGGADIGLWRETLLFVFSCTDAGCTAYLSGHGCFTRSSLSAASTIQCIAARASLVDRNTN